MAGGQRSDGGQKGSDEVGRLKMREMGLRAERESKRQAWKRE